MATFTVANVILSCQSQYAVLNTSISVSAVEAMVAEEVKVPVALIMSEIRI